MNQAQLSEQFSQYYYLGQVNGEDYIVKYVTAPIANKLNTIIYDCYKVHSDGTYDSVDIKQPRQYKMNIIKAGQRVRAILDK